MHYVIMLQAHVLLRQDSALTPRKQQELLVEQVSSAMQQALVWMLFRLIHAQQRLVQQINTAHQEHALLRELSVSHVQLHNRVLAALSAETMELVFQLPE